ILKDIEIDGSYFDSRMIDNYIYVVATEYSYEIYQEFNEGNATLNIPEVTINNDTTRIPYDHIYYVDIPERIDTMTHIIAINLDNNDVKQESFLLGSSQNIYVSQKNIFLAYTKYDYYIQPRLLIGTSSNDNEESTIIYKISIKDDDISYEGDGEVPGRIINQFSMDEYDGFFRIATTIGYSWGENEQSSNNVYILDENLERVSEIEDIAPGEQIYSARFMGEKAYLVTFKNTDPFFTLDLSDPYNPEILGSLKIPGYSNYLHPLDENHIIGFGKDTVESYSPDFAWYQGLKIALFDVSDFDNPIELDKVIIGDRGTDSPALYDHKAFLFDLEKELLVIPVSLYEISNEVKDKYNEYEGSEYGEFTYQGAYVYQLNLDGFEYRGRITHMDDSDMKQNEWYSWWSSSSYIYRSLYIDDVLYTISDKMIKMNNLDDLNEVNSVELE
ncbi:MAG: beta-propeller domain-containing protein, partial [Thermoplasmatales archaeon]|nr:beta-propeller domain-containing protein [Thermoplasmatales archaeon]